MRSQRCRLAHLTIVVSLFATLALAALLVGCGPRPGGWSTPPAQAPEQEAAVADTLPADAYPLWTLPPNPEVPPPSPYPAPDYAAVTLAPPPPSVVPNPTPTAFWHWPTPVRPQRPTPTALPPRTMAESPEGTLWTFVQAEEGTRRLERL